METQRIIALIVFTASSFFLWEAWQKHQHPAAYQIPTKVAAEGTKVVGDAASLPEIAAKTEKPGVKPDKPVVDGAIPSSDKRIKINTDQFAIELDTQGGDIRKVRLLGHAAHGDKIRRLELMGDSTEHFFITQTGLLGPNLPNHTTGWNATSDHFDIGPADTLEVPLLSNPVDGIAVKKTYVFKRGSYLVDVHYEISNQGAAAISPSAYFQFLRDSNPPEGESSGGNPLTSGVSTFTGPAVYTDAKKYQKIAFSEIDKGKTEFVKEASDGWLAMVQHFFVSAWLPQPSVKREFFTKRVNDKLYSAGIILPVDPIEPGAKGQIKTALYMGPQEQEKLKAIAPGLEVVVDYGVFTVIASPMFALLAWIHKLIGNWGWTIIIFTILIKLVFFPLNQKAGKSMAHMKRVAPKIEALKTRYGEDRVKLNQAMMELYKTEKINPLGGCLPMLVQMPFFFALYWVLLGAVELRNAPWLGWITDLSSPDPYYVLPIIMGASMLIQTKINGLPADPAQAKVMMIMPLIFSVMFLFFPSGLVLYWTVQNILGIAQQWYINKLLAAPANGVKTAK